MLRDYGEPRGHKTVVKRPDSEMHTGFTDTCKITDRNDFCDAFIFDQSGQTFTRTLGIARDDDRSMIDLGADVDGKGREQVRGLTLPLWCKVAPYAATGVDHAHTCRLL